ncbi:hypothetical protein [Burkholderia sp. MSMB175]|uniref:hypothetical protein n=1 Tax=Burkholderia sp. MSMB175 TaxID=1086510 RepID=UPI0015E07BA6|nr:hypothetical protein [Burkholderia sp. MSMB175]
MHVSESGGRDSALPPNIMACSDRPKRGAERYHGVFDHHVDSLRMRIFLHPFEQIDLLIFLHLNSPGVVNRGYSTWRTGRRNLLGIFNTLQVHLMLLGDFIESNLEFIFCVVCAKQIGILFFIDHCVGENLCF